MQAKKIVTAAIIQVDGKYLLCQRGVNSSHSLRWEFPGGKLEAGETPEACLAREIKEELNLDIEVAAACCEVPFQHAAGDFVLKVYRANIIGGSLQLLVHQAFAWVEGNQLLEYNLLPADVEVVRNLALG